MQRRTLLGLALGVLVGAAAFGILSSSSSGASAPTDDPMTAARFELSIDGHSLAVFSELAGISSGVDAAELALTGRGDDTAIRLPGKRTPPTVTLKRGLTRSLEIDAWHELVQAGSIEAATRDVTLTVYNVEGQPVARYHLTDAWPSKLEVGGLKAGASEVLMETVTMTCEFIQRVAV